MKSRKAPTASRVVDYSAARARAIRWLGDRYLLAKPINPGLYGPRPASSDATEAATASAVASLGDPPSSSPALSFPGLETF
jgi:hypothetical protein